MGSVKLKNKQRIKNQLHIVFRTQQGRQDKLSVKTLYSLPTLHEEYTLFFLSFPLERKKKQSVNNKLHAVSQTQQCRQKEHIESRHSIRHFLPKFRSSAGNAAKGTKSKHKVRY